MVNTDLSRELMAGTPNQINKMTEDPDDARAPEAGVRAAEVTTVPSGPSVIVKSASQSVPDMMVDCLPEWTVLDLKQFLSNEHSLKPAVKEQRLIYSGHLMTDDNLLTSSLKHASSMDGRFVLHLVCAPSRIPKPDGSLPYVTPTSPSAVANTSTSSSHPINNPLASSSTSGLRQRGSSAQPSVEDRVHLGGTDMPMVDVRAQAEAYKQYYETYMRSYMAYLQSAGVSVNTADPSLMAAWRQQLLALPEQLPAAPASLAPDVPEQQQQPPPREAQPPQPQLNVDELQFVDEDAVPHDWLDSLYIFVRFGILVFFVYFYSSFYRFFIIITVGVLFYLYRVGWFRTIALPVEEVRPRQVMQQQQVQEPLPHREPHPTPARPGVRDASDQNNTSTSSSSMASSSAGSSSVASTSAGSSSVASTSAGSSSVASTSAGSSSVASTSAGSSSVASTSAGSSSVASTSADTAAAGTSASDAIAASAIPSDFPHAAATMSSPSTAPANASKTEDAGSFRADSTTSERETASSQSTTSTNVEAESVSAATESQGGLNNDPPIEAVTPAATGISTDSATEEGATAPPPAASFLTLSWTFITALLTSLVPDQQQIL
ncbi:Ubiquitin-related domain [Trinorchestia longiramus]|nr:Ubiquitin-related domain [Trinorchestia longiramus]